MPEQEGAALIRVVGVGGGGSNAVNRMIEESIAGVDFIAVNTDQQALMGSRAKQRVAIGERTTRGLGSGGDPEVGGKSAEESEDDLHSVLQGSDMVFVTAGMGGGTGTGATPIVAKVAREVGALSIGVVTRPFTFEGAQRSRIAEQGIEQLKEYVDTLIVIPNDRLLEAADKRVSLLDSFRLADDVLRQGIQGISELITVPGLINLDFADVKTIMSLGGAALMAVGTGSGDDRAREAAEQALSSHLLDVTIDGARGILFNVTGGSDLSLYEINQAASIIRETAHPDVNLIFGAVIDEDMGEEIRITVIATGFEHGMPLVRTLSRPVSQPSPREMPSQAPVRESVPVSASAKRSSSESSSSVQPDYRINDLDIPAFLRKRR
jgi:cell division protein FtsZ